MIIRSNLLSLLGLASSSILCVDSFVHHPTHQHTSYDQHTSKTSKTLIAATSNDDDFDPLLSPHAYPNGTGNRNGNGSSASSSESNEEDWSPMKMSSVKKDFEGASTEDYKVERASFTREWSASSTSENLVDDEAPSNEKADAAVAAELFDPLLSPHAYPNGTKSGPVARKDDKKKKEKKQIGVLLIDHGSKRESSNARLETLAEIYQKRAPSHHTVKFAHMEIAPPSIEDGIREFCNEGVMDIVCHPYFLSPGRHVLEDIPELIEAAVVQMKEEGMGDELTVRTTEPVGSDLEQMVDLISRMVGNTLGDGDEGAYESGFLTKKKSEMGALGGFFGEVQRMVDEQL